MLEEFIDFLSDNVLLSAAIVGFVLLLWRILFFLEADADLELLRRQRYPADTFKDKVAWVTGASQGIGRQLAIALAQNGASVYLLGRNLGKLESVRQQCEGIGAKSVHIVPLDLSSGEKEIHEVVRKCMGENDDVIVDFLFHSAAFPRDKMTCEETSEDVLKAMFQVNVFGTISLTKALIPHMKKKHAGGKGGRIVVISSAAGLVASPTQGAYAASKHAINGYFNSLRYELVPSGVDVIIVCPGPIQSEEEAVQRDKDKNRLACSRCVSLVLSSAASGLEETWVSKHPVLLLLYVMKYFPALGRLVLRKVGPKRVQSLKEGRSDLLYSSNLLFDGTSGEEKHKDA